MDFTGERYVPERKGDISLEHHHRYLLACNYAKDKDVLDIACGEGYGSSILATVAKNVIGVDIAPEVVAHAAASYRALNLHFKQGNAAEIPLEDSSIDLVVSFETIEHHDRHKDMMREIKRVLRPNGLLIISSPDKYEYSDVPGDKNEFHVKELYKDEFEDLLAAHFAHYKLSGQRVVYASVLASNNGNEPFISWENASETVEAGLSHPLYFIALASDGIIPAFPHSVLKMPVVESDCARGLMKDLDIQCKELHDRDNHILLLKDNLHELDVQIATLKENINILQDQKDSIQEELTSSQGQNLTLQTKLNELYSSRSWRLTSPLRKGMYKIRNWVAPRPHCGMISIGVMALALLPAFLVCNGGVRAGIRALRKGKPAFTSVLTNGIYDLRHIYDRQTLWSLCMASLIFAKRIRKNGSVLAALYITWKATRKDGRQGLLYELDSKNSDGGRICKFINVMNCIQREEIPIPAASPTTVVIPVYNSYAYLEKLCSSLFAHSPENTRYIFVDDASPDPLVHDFLQTHISPRSDCLLLRNEKNLGFVKTVNLAVKHVKTPYFVLLNTDVEVPQYWLERLIAPFTQDGHIASVTPFSNSAVYFSYPIEGQDNVIPEETTPEELDRAFSRLSPVINSRCTVHSGVGFCMAVNKTCWDSIGPLDDIAFDRGYGEECDWCMRATTHNWRNVLVPNLFVYHAHGGSFASEEKQRLMREHSKILQIRWPKQMATARKHEQQDPWECYRAAASLLLANADNPEKKTILLVDVALNSGGACAYREKTIKDMQDKGHRVLLLQFTQTGSWMLTPRYLNGQSIIYLDCLGQMSQVFELLQFNEIFVNNLAYCQDTEQVLDLLAALKKQQGPLLTYMFHDFYSICPSFFLLDEFTCFCAGGSPERCPKCAQHNINFVVPRTDIRKWRAKWEAFFKICDRFTFFSQSTLDIVNTIYSIRDRGSIIEHDLLAPFSHEYVMPPASAPLVIGFLGPFVEQKGANFIRDMAKLLQKKDPCALIHTFGSHFEGVYAQGNLRFEGPYIRDNIPSMLTEKGVKVVVLPSPSPETYSYIAQECMVLNVPLVCFDIGAPAERIRKYAYKYGALAPEFSAESLLATVEQLLDRIYSEDAMEHKESLGGSL